MTDPKNRAAQRAVRRYQREHPGVTLRAAQQAVAARAAGCPRPAPAEPLVAYVRRVAGYLEVGLHQAMEVLGLEPGASASERLDQLAAGIDERTMARMRAATGFGGELVRFAVGEAKPGTVSEAFPRIRPGGRDKTRSTIDVAASLSPYGSRTLVIDLDGQAELAWPVLDRAAPGEPDMSAADCVVIDTSPSMPVPPWVDEVPILLQRARGGGVAGEIDRLLRQQAGPRPRRFAAPGWPVTGRPGDGQVLPDDGWGDRG